MRGSGARELYPFAANGHGQSCGRAPRRV